MSIRWPWNARINAKTPDNPFLIGNQPMEDPPTPQRSSTGRLIKSDPPILPAPMQVQITGTPCMQVGPIKFPRDMYGETMLVVWDDQTQAWNRMRAEDADRVVKALNDVAAALNAWKGAVQE